jgi:hypothetical protein
MTNRYLFSRKNCLEMESYYITLFSFLAAPAEYSFRPNICPIIFGRILGRKRFRSITILQHRNHLNTTCITPLTLSFSRFVTENKELRLKMDIVMDDNARLKNLLVSYQNADQVSQNPLFPRWIQSFI